MKGRQKLMLDGGPNPVRHDERRNFVSGDHHNNNHYGSQDHGEEGVVIRDDRDRVTWPDFDQEYWFRRTSMNTRTGEARLTISVESEGGAGTVRSELQRFALEGTMPAFSLIVDRDNSKKCLVLRSSVLQGWKAFNPTFVDE